MNANPWAVQARSSVDHSINEVASSLLLAEQGLGSRASELLVNIAKLPARKSKNMPRQPFLPGFAHLQFAVGALVLNDRPELSAALGRCIAIWSQVENEMGNLFGILLGTGSDAALEIFLTLRRSANQREALSTAAKFALMGEELQVAEALLKLFASLERERNSLAHGCFGVAANDPSILLWIDIRNHVHFQTEVLSKMARGEMLPDPLERLKENMFVYRTADLQSLQVEVEQLWEATLNLNAYLRQPNRSPKSDLFQRIQSFPPVKRVLAQQRT